MNTKTNDGRLARLEENQARIAEKQDSTNEKLDYLVDRFDRFVDRYDTDKEGMLRKFVTRAEAIAVSSVISLVVAVIMLWLAFTKHNN